jgi:hypothetical protein
MITFARAAISRIAVHISSARPDDGKAGPPPVAGCQSGETDHGLPGSSPETATAAYLIREPSHPGPEQREPIVCTGDPPLFPGVQ